MAYQGWNTTPYANGNQNSPQVQQRWTTPSTPSDQVPCPLPRGSKLQAIPTPQNPHHYIPPPSNQYQPQYIPRPARQLQYQHPPPPVVQPPVYCKDQVPRGIERIGNQFMQRPTGHGIPNCPAGLEYLTRMSHLFVNQQVEALEIIAGCETENVYLVQNSLGQNVYIAKEESNRCRRTCFGSTRAFNLYIKDYSGNKIIHINRPCRCQCCWCPCCLQEIIVSSPPGNIIGMVKQKWSIGKPKFNVQDENGNVMLKIKGPFCLSSICGGNVDFQVLSNDGRTEVGKISKKWTDFVQEESSDADIFGISFPVELDVKVKATLLGAVFLIDFMYFED